MLKNLKHYAGIYSTFIATSISQASGFRVSFALLIIMDLFFYGSTLFTVDFMFDHMEKIGPWNKDQLMFFLSFMLAIDHLHMTFVSESFWDLAFNIRTGHLDYTLLKPVDTLFNVFFRTFRPSSFCNILIIWPTVIYYGISVNLTTLSWFLLPLLLFTSFCLLLILEFFISTAMFWVQEGVGINFLRMQMQSLARWPHFIYASFYRKVLWVALPVLAIGSSPIEFMLDNSAWYYLVYQLIAILVFYPILRWSWDKALIRYESASS